MSYKGLINPIALNFNKIGLARVQLPPGPADDSHKVFIHVRIIDNFGGTTEHQILSPIFVQPNFNLATSFLNEISNNKNTKTFIKQLYAANLQQTTQNIISFATNLNLFKLNNNSYSVLFQLVYSFLKLSSFYIHRPAKGIK